MLLRGVGSKPETPAHTHNPNPPRDAMSRMDENVSGGSELLATPSDNTSPPSSRTVRFLSVTHRCKLWERDKTTTRNVRLIKQKMDRVEEEFSFYFKVFTWN